MIIVNFSHPLTAAQIRQIATLAGEAVEREIHVPVHFDEGEQFGPQIRQLIDGIDVPADRWEQPGALLLIPPAYAPAAVLLLAELHGRVGHFPAYVRLRPRDGSTLPGYDVAEIINLQAVRDAARRRRGVDTPITGA